MGASGRSQGMQEELLGNGFWVKAVERAGGRNGGRKKRGVPKPPTRIPRSGSSKAWCLPKASSGSYWPPATGVEWARFLYIDRQKLPAAVPIVVQVEAGSEGEKAGLQRGDVVWKVNGKSLPAGDALPSFRSLLAATKPGEPLVLDIGGMDFGKSKHRLEKPTNPRKAEITLIQGAQYGKPLREAKDGEFDRWKMELITRLAITP